MNTKLHAICDSQGRPLNLFMTAGQVSGYIGARALLSSLPDVDWLLGDRGCDADWFREALKDKGIRACIPGRKQRKKPVKYDKRRYKRRNRIEIMFGRLKDWRRVATRYDRCLKVFLSAIALHFMSPSGYSGTHLFDDSDRSSAGLRCLRRDLRQRPESADARR